MAIIRCPNCGASVDVEGDVAQCPSCLGIVTKDSITPGGGFPQGGPEPVRGKDPFEPEREVDGIRVDGPRMEPVDRREPVGPREPVGGSRPGAFQPATGGDEGSGVVGFLLAFFLGIIGLIIALVLKKRKTTKVAVITFVIMTIVEVGFYILYAMGIFKGLF